MRARVRAARVARVVVYPATHFERGFGGPIMPAIMGIWRSFTDMAQRDTGVHTREEKCNALSRRCR